MRSPPYLNCERLRRGGPGGRRGGGDRLSQGEAGAGSRPARPLDAGAWTASTALPKLRDAAPSTEVVVLTASEGRGQPAGRDSQRRSRLPAEERAARAHRRVPARRRRRGEAALSGAVARRLLDQVREEGRRAVVPESVAQALTARELEVLLLLDRSSRHRGDRPAPLHLRAHGALAREEPASRSSASRPAARRSRRARELFFFFFFLKKNRQFRSR